DCVDQSLSAELLGGMTTRDLFVDSCSDFDSSAARQCLRGMRKIKRKCDENAGSDDQEKACAEVCGTPKASAMLADPMSLEAALDLMDTMPQDEQDQDDAAQ
ncbi:MAG: hypothetical protein K0V04_00230, partial [Deltaproteobacteria bacterium]|nr:hypothetical protein [Deltaproteobacteria bacterium]